MHKLPRTAHCIIKYPVQAWKGFYLLLEYFHCEKIVYLRIPQQIKACNSTSLVLLVTVITRGKQLCMQKIYFSNVHLAGKCRNCKRLENYVKKFSLLKLQSKLEYLNFR